MNDPPGRRRVGALALRRLALMALALVLVGLALEATLRMVYLGGASVPFNTGALARRFNRDFVLNRYDGSRGPQLDRPGPPGALRVLVQGDSVTWGVGVKREADLFTSRLLEQLRRHDPRTQMAVLAAPGREMDGHLDQLRRWGGELRPQVVVYQWAVNDLEIDKARRPGRPRLYQLWRRLFLRDRMVEHSYLFALLDLQVRRLLPPGPPRYADYLGSEFAPGSPGWQRFELTFGAWLAETRTWTPRVLILLQPDGQGADRTVSQFEALCARLGVVTVRAELAYTRARDRASLRASPFDDHPSAEAHRLLAALLGERLFQLWPALGPAAAPALPSTGPPGRGSAPEPAP